MKKQFRKLLLIALSVVFIMGMSATAFAADGGAGTELTITNNTNMFKAVSAHLETEGSQTNLVVALSGSGYHYLYKGTYEDAVENGDNPENWIEGHVNEAEKWEFVIPLKAGETYIPVVAISNSYYEKYKKGENLLERAFYARQMEVDATAKTLVTGDYDHETELTVINKVKMFKPGEKATLRVIGGPNSNNYATLLTLNMGSGSYTKAKGAGDVEVELSDGNKFIEIPVVVNENQTLEFWSQKNEKWYPRDLFIDTAAKTASFYPSDVTAEVAEVIAQETEAAAVEYATTNASPKLGDALITSIQVQDRDENTDKLCAAAKACWDALTDGEKAQMEDPDYFGLDTGDASKDDPLNQDEIGEKELLVVSFGTSFNGSRAEDIGGVEKALAEAYPGWAVRRAFTAQIIINHVQARDGEKIDNMQQALDRAVANGVKKLVVQPTHLMHGAEYDEMVTAINAINAKFDSVEIAEPLLGPVGATATEMNADKEAAAKAMVAEAVAKAGASSLEELDTAKTAIVFMGHGTGHNAAITYSQMQNQMTALGYKNVFVGTVEGNPAETALPEVKKAVENAGYTKVILRPMMVVAGDHANNDMADPDPESGSWYAGFAYGGEFEVEGAEQPVDVGAGFGPENVFCQIEGLGRIAAIQGMYVGHTHAVVAVDQAMTVKANNKTYKVKQLKKKAIAFKAVTVKGAKTKVTYAGKATNAKSKKALKFNAKNGKITVKKGTKKGTYKMKITVKAPASAEYKAATATKTVTVKVK